MSLFVGIRPVGRASSRRLAATAGDFRAFQTLSATAAAPTERNGEKDVAAAAGSARKWTKASIPTSALFAQTTRSMAGLGAPENNNFRDGKPTLEYATKLPKTFASMTNEQVLHFAEMGVPEACRECIVRDVMGVDRVEYDEAMKVFNEIAKTNREGMFEAALPFYCGFGASMIGGMVSFPLVFERGTVEWFNEKFVTAEMPPEEDLETWLEVGSASWGWMEPVMGQLSFFLLCMQFARSQLQNLGIRPFFNWQKEFRARRLVQRYPQYDPEFLIMYSKIDRLAEKHVMSA